MNQMHSDISLLLAILAIICVLNIALKPADAKREDSDTSDARNEMIAALTATGPDSSLGNEAQVFDRLIGDWDCDFGFYNPDGTVRHTSGELLFGWIIDGFAIQDIWISYSENQKERNIGTSIRFFDQKAKTWQVVFLSPQFSSILKVQGGLEEDRIILRGKDDQGNRIRWSFNDIRKDSFLWRGETSYDDGRTWKLEEEHHMTRRNSGQQDRERQMVRGLRANGPNPALGSHAKLFDQFVGAWNLDCTFFYPDGSSVRFQGAWIFGWVLDGRVLQDVLMEGSGRKRGTTTRFFDEKSGQWRVVWVQPHSGYVIELKGGAAGDRIVLHGKDADGSDLRWSFNDIRPDSFFWRGETSSDGGKTWRTEQEMRLNRRSIR